MSALLGAIVVSACLGALVGLIRQWSDQKEQGGDADFGGVRTFTLWSLLGCLAAYLSEHYSTAVLPVVLVAVGGFLTAAHFREPAGARPGNTTFAAAILTCLVGALVNWGLTQPAVVVAALTMVMLGIKGPVHAWTRGFTVEDIHSTLQFVAITGVVLPLVPDRAFGPYEAFNPYDTWLMVVLISGLGFIGYIAMRLLGHRAGIFLTSLLGGLASSTASTLAFSRQSRDDAAFSTNYSFAVVSACTVMLPRVLVVVSFVSPELARPLLLPFALMTLPAVGYGLWLWRRRAGEGSALPSRGIANPLRLLTAIKFGLIYTLVAFLLKAATRLEWHAGILPLSFLSGLTDMDAISLSMAGSQAAGATPLTLAVRAIVVAAVANSLVKAGLAVSLGSPVLKRHVAIVLGLTALVGVATLFF